MPWSRYMWFKFGPNQLRKSNRFGHSSNESGHTLHVVRFIPKIREMESSDMWIITPLHASRFNFSCTQNGLTVPQGSQPSTLLRADF